jgi:DNA-binding response OmpR family regulator
MQAFIREALQADDHDLYTVPSGEAALDNLAWSAPDLVLLDLQLAGQLTGFDVLAALRQRNRDARVIILTHLPGEERTIRGLDLGADDYLAKGLSTAHLLARVRAQIRRTSVGVSPTYRNGNVTIDLEANRLIIGDRRWPLGRPERGVLARLIQEAGQAVSVRDLVRAGWNYELPPVVVDEDLHMLRQLVSRLRKRMGSMIMTHRGGGYVLVAPVAEGQTAAPPV